MIDPHLPPELIGEHSPEKDEHVAILKEADAAIRESKDHIEKGMERLERLQRAIARYEERSRGV